MKLRETLVVGALAFGFSACGGAEEEEPIVTSPTGESEGIGKGTGKEDAWDYRNDPTRLADFVNKNLKYQIEALPKSGEAANKPWPASYWPTYMDSSNHRWRGADELSPLEKYDVAYNGWDASEVSSLRPFDPNNCEAGFDGEYYEKLGPAAGWMSNNKGNKPSRELYTTEGVNCDEENPVETWWGLCHAWAPAANIEKEPIYPVTVDGVTFYPADIKALILTVYDANKSVILGGRCNTKEVERDDNGRIIDDNCRDTNAGAFYVSLANLIGIYGLSFQEDRTYNYEVWNQPILSYEVTQFEEIPEARAIELLVADPTTVDSYPYNADAKKFAEVFLTVEYITESHQEERALIPELARYTRRDNYKFILEMDAAGNVIGGEWLQGRANHTAWGVSEQPDFLWITTGPSTGSFSRSNPHLDYTKVQELIELSRRAPTTGGTGTGGTDAVDTRAAFGMTGDPIAIPDNDAAGIAADVHVGESRTSTKVEVQVDIKHTYIGDLVITLKNNDTGFSTVLHDRAGGSADDLSLNLEIPELSGMDLQGAWTLTVSDNANIDLGQLMTWALIAH